MQNKKYLKTVGIIEAILAMLLGVLIICLPFIKDSHGQPIDSLMSLSGYILSGYIILNGLVIIIVKIAKNRKLDILYIIGSIILALGIIMTIIASKKINIVVELFPFVSFVFLLVAAVNYMIDAIIKHKNKLFANKTKMVLEWVLVGILFLVAITILVFSLISDDVQILKIINTVFSGAVILLVSAYALIKLTLKKKNRKISSEVTEQSQSQIENNNSTETHKIETESEGNLANKSGDETISSSKEATEENLVLDPSPTKEETPTIEHEEEQTDTPNDTQELH